MMKQMIGFLVALMFAGGALAQDGTITWSWTAPTTNEDGTPLTDLAGYTVYFGADSRVGRCGTRGGPGCYDSDFQVTDAGASFTFSVTETSQFYSSVTAVDASGNESNWSNEVSFTVNVDSFPSVPTDVTVDCTFDATNVTCTLN